MLEHQEAYSSHPFHRPWKRLKTEIENIDEKEIKNVDRLNDILKIKAVVNYINSCFRAIDTNLLTEKHILLLGQINTYTNQAWETICYGGIRSRAYAHVGIEHRNINSIDFKEVGNYIDKILYTLKELPISLSKITSEEIISITNQYHETFSNALKYLNKEKDKLTKQLEEQKEKLIAQKEEYDSAIKQAEDKLAQQLKEQKEEYDGVIQQSEGKLKEQLEQHKTEYENLLEQAKNELAEQKKIYEEREKQIEGLLPGATNVGLARSFQKEKEKFAAPIKRWNWIFIGTMIGMIALSSYLVIGGGGFTDVMNSFLLKMPIYIPLVWLAIYASKRRSEFQRLEQEYVHKETVAMSYDSYKRQIENLDVEEGELLSKLMEASINALAKNASETLGKHSSDSPTSEMLKFGKSDK